MGLNLDTYYVGVGYTLGMYRYLRLHYLYLLPSAIATPLLFSVYYHYILGLGAENDMSLAFMLGAFFLCFFVGQLLMFVMIRTRSDVRLSRTLGSYEAFLLGLLHLLLFLTPLFDTRYNSQTRVTLPSLASEYMGFLFSSSSGVIAAFLFFAVPILYIYIFFVVAYERLHQTSLEMHIPGRE